MNIHEYQAKELLRSYGISVPRGVLISSKQEASAIIDSLDYKTWAVKAQVHAGGRGKAGGVKIAHDSKDALNYVEEILGISLVTKQTGSEGRLVRKVYLEEGVNIERELYLSLLLDRDSSALIFVVSQHGGSNIEEISETHPSEIHKTLVLPELHLKPFHCRKMAEHLQIPPDLLEEFQHICYQLYSLFLSTDAQLIELNPLVITKEGQLVSIDAKISFDKNGLFRHPELVSLNDPNEQSEKEVEASRADLNYIELDGNIGCMVNGAGLAMATMDIIKLHGGDPANFLDIGGGASKEQVVSAFKIIQSSASVKAIFVNIFGGIIHCDIIAQGIVEAAEESNLDIPLVVRLQGTNAEKGRELIKKQNNINIVVASSLSEGAQKVVELVRGDQR